MSSLKMASIEDFLMKESNLSIQQKYQQLLENIASFENGHVISLESFKDNLLRCKNSDEIKRVVSRYLETRNNKIVKVHNIVASVFGNNPTPLGIKISKTIIRVVATRIFADPEQSIMEPIVNSIDSYRSQLRDHSLVGKFGIGLFSLLFWISQSLNGNYDRSLVITSTYNDNGTLFSYKVYLQWTREGLNYMFFPEPPGINTGTKIELRCELFPLTDKNISRMEKYVQRLSDINDVQILCNDKIINRTCTGHCKKKRVIIKLSKTYVSIEDFASGIDIALLESVILVPTISTKPRMLNGGEERESFIRYNGKQYFSLKINCLGVCLIDIKKNIEFDDLGYDYVINMPDNSKLPISRDDVIIEKDSNELIAFRNAISFILNQIIETVGNISYFMCLLKEYSAINKSPYLVMSINDIVNQLHEKHYIFVPNNIFWRTYISSYSSKEVFILYDKSLLFDAEQKFLNRIDNTERSNRIFKLRTVISCPFLKENKAETGGFVTVLFVKNIRNISNSIIMSHSNSLLIPYEEKTNYFPPVDFEVDNDIKKIIGILFLTYRRKTSAFYDQYVFNTLVDTVKLIIERCSTENVKLFLTMISSRIADSHLHVIYGHMFGQRNAKFHIPLDWEYEDPENIFVSSEMDQRLFRFYVDCISEVHDGMFTIPDIRDFVLMIDDERLLTELDILLDNFVGNGEIFILSMILREVNFIRSFHKNEKITGVTLYILSEIRRIISNSMIEIEVQRFYSNISNEIPMHFLVNIIEPIVFSTISYLDILNRSFPFSDEVILPADKFSCKSMIHYMFTNDVETINYNDIIMLHYDFDISSVPLKILEIAVNDGTSKQFIPAMITELFQNSLDAIRDSGSRREIKFLITQDSISIEDPVGIDELHNVLIPFLSSKDPNNPNVTGEMGTGFFNVYRQPWVKTVEIVTKIRGTKTRVVGVPLVENGNVHDIEYYYDEFKTNEENGTIITVHFNRKIGILSSLITDSYLFIGKSISLCRSCEIQMNDKVINCDLISVFEDDEFGNFYISTNPRISSQVMTNEIPFCQLKDLEYIPREYVQIIEKFGLTSIVLDISKNIYVPTQSRNKITIKPSMHQEFVDFLTEGIIIVILEKYSRGMIDHPDDIIDHTNSKSKCTQLKPKIDGNRFLEYSFHVNYMGTINLTVGEIIHFIIELGSSNRIQSIDQLEKTTPLLQRIIDFWFDGKQLVEQFRPVLSFTIKPYKIPCPMLTAFSDIYFQKVRRLIRNETIGGVFIEGNHPPVIFVPPDPSTNGFYDGSFIFINGEKSEKDMVEQRIIRNSERNVDYVKLLVDPVLSKYFATSLPTPTLIHELTHAIFQTIHKSGTSSHGRTSLILEDNLCPEFETAAIEIYKLVIIEGLFEDFFEWIRNNKH